MAFDFGRDNGIDYLVTEYVPGLTLDAKIAGRPLPEGGSSPTRQATCLWPGNRAPPGSDSPRPEAEQFEGHAGWPAQDSGFRAGLPDAKPETESTATAPLTDTYSDAGTVPYMAPEQIKGTQPDARADVWSAGAVLYEMSTGKRPFGDLMGPPLIAAILEQAPVPPREVNPKISEGLERVILRALQKDPKERYQSAGDLRIDLANLATRDDADLSETGRPSPRWRRWLLVVAVAVAGRGHLVDATALRAPALPRKG